MKNQLVITAIVALMTSVSAGAMECMVMGENPKEPNTFDQLIGSTFKAPTRDGELNTYVITGKGTLAKLNDQMSSDEVKALQGKRVISFGRNGENHFISVLKVSLKSGASQVYGSAWGKFGQTLGLVSPALKISVVCQ